MRRWVKVVITKVMAELERRRRTIVLAHVRGRLLDIGCGENRLVRQYGDGIGVDVYDWGSVDLVVEDSACLPFPDQSFDTISFVACLNHIPNREEVLQEAYRLLRDDGQILITMIPPFIGMIWHRIVAPCDTDQTERGMKPAEVWGLTTRQIRQLLCGAGFELVAHKRFVFWLNNLYIAVKKPRITSSSAKCNYPGG